MVSATPDQVFLGQVNDRIEEAVAFFANFKINTAVFTDLQRLQIQLLEARAQSENCHERLSEYNSIKDARRKEFDQISSSLQEKNLVDVPNIDCEARSITDEISCKKGPPQPEEDEVLCEKRQTFVKEKRIVSILNRAEFDSIPPYMRGRLTQDDLNAIVRAFDEFLLKKSILLSKNPRLFTKTERALVDIWRSQHIEKLQSTMYCMESDIKPLLEERLRPNLLKAIPCLRHMTERDKEWAIRRTSAYRQSVDQRQNICLERLVQWVPTWEAVDKTTKDKDETYFEVSVKGVLKNELNEKLLREGNGKPDLEKLQLSVAFSYPTTKRQETRMMTFDQMKCEYGTELVDWMLKEMTIGARINNCFQEEHEGNLLREPFKEIKKERELD